MKTDDLREAYLSFFESKGCVRRPSDVLVPKGDPTVLFTPAGMNQFKNEFLGLGRPDFKRATTCQKCIRTGDIDNVGVTAYHHTFFEMLGNFSFGDYFKKEAIHWGWEFLTSKKWLGIPAEKLTVTVYLDDDEAADIWHKEIGLPKERIVRNDEYENFWPAGSPTNGPDGVCGPCSEIYYHPGNGAKEVEIWNLVFTQFNRVGAPPNNLKPLPSKNIDTGMGLERCASVLQGVKSNFEIDTLRPLCLAAAEVVGVKYDFDAQTGRPIRRIADHIRAVTMCGHEGVAPSNVKQGYVIRQLLRRAVLEGYLLGRHEPFLYRLVPAVVEAMRRPYPEIAETAQSVAGVVKEEEERFLGTIDRGLARFEKAVETAEWSGASLIPGDVAWDLHSTYGFLVEISEAMAARHNLAVDRAEFNKLREEHEKTSGSGAFLDAVMSAGPLDALRKDYGAVEFLGYDATEATGKVVGIIAQGRLVESLDEVGHAEPVGLVLDRTPFYGEAGGQVGDTGTITGEGFEFRVIDAQKDGELILHIGHLQRGAVKVGAEAKAAVECGRRSAIRRAHSATHLLHHALHTVLGKDATQRGSKVQPDELRFDFNHRQAVTAEQLEQIEDIVNARVSEGAAVNTRVLPAEEAKKLGAMALFGERYPDFVRVVGMGEFSLEFCGGTHLSSTGQVGLFKIVGEEAVGTGVRRITAFTGPKALGRIREEEALLERAAAMLKAPRAEDIPRRIEAIQNELKAAKKSLAEQTSKSVASVVDDLLAGAEEVAGVKLVAYVPENATRDMLRDLADRLRGGKQPVALIVGGAIDGKASLLAAVSKDLVKTGLKAGDAVKAAAEKVGGGGGGRPDLAEAGGKNPENLPEALKAGLEVYRKVLAG
jgi:alanyl-tRNA synthetase